MATDRITIETSGDNAWKKARDRLDKIGIDMGGVTYITVELLLDDGELVSVELIGLDDHFEEPLQRKTPEYTEPQVYDIQDKPARGRILEIVGESDGVSRSGILDLTEIKDNTLDSALQTMIQKRLLEKNGKYYYLADRGNKVLGAYRRRWANGHRNLPNGFWSEQMGFQLKG